MGKYEIGEVIYAKWPGSKLYYKAKLTGVLEDDELFEVEFLDTDAGAMTIDSKHSYSVLYMEQNSNSPARKKRTTRSHSRSRSPGRSSPGRKTTRVTKKDSPAKSKSPVRRPRSPSRRTAKNINDELEKISPDKSVSVKQVRSEQQVVKESEEKSSFSATASSKTVSIEGQFSTSATTRLTRQPDRLTPIRPATVDMSVKRRTTRSSAAAVVPSDIPPEEIDGGVAAVEEEQPKTLVCHSLCVLKSFGSLVQNLLTITLPFVLFALLYLNCRSKKKCELFRMPVMKKKDNLEAYFNMETTAYVFGWMIFQGLLCVLPVGKLALGPPSKTSPRKAFRLNGTFMLVTNISLFGLLVHYGYWPMKLLTSQYLQMMTSAALFAVVVSAIVFIHVKVTGTSETSEGLLTDFVEGCAVRPQLFGGNFDVQSYMINSGVIAWIVLDIWYFAKQMKEGTPNHSLTLVTAMQLIYALDLFIFEEATNYTATLSREKFGFGFASLAMLWSPFFCTTQARYLSLSPVSFPAYCYVPILFIFVVGYYIYRVSTLQKFTFRKDPHNSKLNGVDYICTDTGKDLLVEGWWGRLRHPNYIGDLLTCIAFALPCGFTHFLPWVSPVVLLLTLVGMSMRDNAASAGKYGKAWNEYTERVKYNLVPGVW